MTVDAEKSTSRKTWLDETSLGRRGNVSQLPNSGAPRNADDEQRAFKKPRLDVSFMLKDVVNTDDDSNSIPRNSNCGDEQDDGKVEELISECIGDCSTCGDVGFQAELFRCTKCCVRLQHTYCSNSYNPRKRWLIGLCNWCEAEAANSRPISGTSTPKCQSQETRRDNGERSSYSWGRGEKFNAVDCLLGAALRLPSAGFSMEDLLQVESRATSLAKRRKPLSFDTVEKAKRTGPTCDNAVKSTNGSVKVEISGATESTHKSSSSSMETTDQALEQQQSPRKDTGLKLKGSLTSCSDIAATLWTDSSIREIKHEGMDVTSHVDERKENGRFSSCDSAEKRQTTTCSEAVIDKARKVKSPHGFAAKVKDLRSPAPLGNGERSDSSLDNAATLKEPNSIHVLDKAVELSRARRFLDNDLRKDSARRSPRCSRESGNVIHGSISSESVKTRTLSTHAIVDKSAMSAEDSDKSRSPTSDSAGGSDCSNITEQRSGGKDSSSSRKHFQIKRSSKQQMPIRQLVRPNHSIGKSPRTSNTDEREHKKIFGQKDSKLRRSSSKISGFHNYKSLSDILC